MASCGANNLVGGELGDTPPTPLLNGKEMKVWLLTEFDSTDTRVFMNEELALKALYLLPTYRRPFGGVQEVEVEE